MHKGGMASGASCKLETIARWKRDRGWDKGHDAVCSRRGHSQERVVKQRCTGVLNRGIRRRKERKLIP